MGGFKLCAQLKLGLSLRDAAVFVWRGKECGKTVVSGAFCQKLNQPLWLRVSPSSPSPVAQQMTAMSISQDSAAVDSERLEADEGEEESTSNSSGKCHRKEQSDLRLAQLCFLSYTAAEVNVDTQLSLSFIFFLQSL